MPSWCPGPWRIAAYSLSAARCRGKGRHHPLALHAGALGSPKLRPLTATVQALFSLIVCCFNKLTYNPHPPARHREKPTDRSRDRSPFPSQSCSQQALVAIV
jgi:hypothetical protein